MSQPIETAPTDRDVMVFNAYYGWYRSRAVAGDSCTLWPLYGLMGREGGVWYPRPSHWMELPPAPDGSTFLGVRTTPQFPDNGRPYTAD